MKKRYVWLAVSGGMCGLLCCAGGGALAAEYAPQPDSAGVVGAPGVEIINGKTYLTITASRIPEKKSEVSANLTVIDREEIENSGADSVADLLAEKGVGHIHKYPGALTSVGIRGFRTDTHGNDLQGHVLVLLDGRRAGTGNLAKILTKNVEKIEIIRGPGAVQYGSGGMGGVVNIITRQGKGNSMFVESGVGSFGEIAADAGATVKEGGFDFAGAVSRSTQDDYKTGSGATFANTGIDSQTGVSLNSGYEFSANNRFGVVVTAFDADGVGDPGYLSANDTDNYNDKGNYSVDSSYCGKSITGRWQWMGRYFFGQMTVAGVTPWPPMVRAGMTGLTPPTPPTSRGPKPRSARPSGPWI